MFSHFPSVGLTSAAAGGFLQPTVAASRSWEIILLLGSGLSSWGNSRWKKTGNKKTSNGCQHTHRIHGTGRKIYLHELYFLYVPHILPETNMT